MRPDQDVGSPAACEVIPLTVPPRASTLARVKRLLQASSASSSSSAASSSSSSAASSEEGATRVALETRPNELAYVRAIRDGEGPAECMVGGLGCFSRRRLVKGDCIPFCGRVTENGRGSYSFRLDDELDLEPDFFCAATRVFAALLRYAAY